MAINAGLFGTPTSPNQTCHVRIVVITLAKIVTIIGSRETPTDVLGIITDIAQRFAEQGWTLRSGGAQGADYASELGFDKVKAHKEIYLPWRGFNGHKSELYSVSIDALKMAQSVIPWWTTLKQGAQKLHGRNCYQVLGQNLKTPSDLVICWTHNGEKIGGTRTAILLAEMNGIPVLNLGTPGVDVEKELSIWLI